MYSLLKIATPNTQNESDTELGDALPQSKGVFIKTWGCQMNVYDSERMEDILAAQGYQTVTSPDQAQLIILNTCHIREKAAEKLYSELGRLAFHKQRKGVKIAVAGCVAQAEGTEIFRRSTAVDFIFGPQNYQELPALLAKVEAPQIGRVKRPIATDFPLHDKFDLLPKAREHAGVTTAFLTIQEGCDKFCSFCVVPYTRGAEYSRPAESIIKEAKELLSRGIKEITLLGQNVNAWHGLGSISSNSSKEWSFGRLLFALAELDGLERIRYTTSHPKDVDDDLIQAHKDIPAIMPLLHLPVQSGSDRILDKMNRKHTAEDYLKLVDRFRQVQPNIAFTSDFIVGYPDESHEDFAQTIGLINKVDFASAFSFIYSPRPGTPAAELTPLDPNLQNERLITIQQLLEAQQERFNQKMEGQIIDVLIEKEGREAGQLVGRSPYLQPVHLNLPNSYIGKMISAKINRVGGYSLFGSLYDPLKEVQPMPNLVIS